MLEDFLMLRIQSLEDANAELRANEVELTTFIYTLLDRDTPQEYKDLNRNYLWKP